MRWCPRAKGQDFELLCLAPSGIPTLHLLLCRIYLHGKLVSPTRGNIAPSQLTSGTHSSITPGPAPPVALPGSCFPLDTCPQGLTHHLRPGCSRLAFSNCLPQGPRPTPCPRPSFCKIPSALVSSGYIHICLRECTALHPRNRPFCGLTSADGSPVL